MAAHARNDWRGGYDLLTRALAASPDDAESLAALADCADWLQLHDESIDAREHAYRVFYRAGDWHNGALAALKLEGDYRNVRAQPAVAAGWLERASGLLEGKPLSVAHLELKRKLAMRNKDPEAALAGVEEVIDLARRLGDHDMETLALAEKGALLVGRGEVEEGRRLQDAALAAAVGGELGPLPTVLVYCGLISACDAMGDIERATEWSDTALRYCDRNSLSTFPGVCRLHRTRMLRLRGAWREAEAEARLAAEALRPSSPVNYGWALEEIADLRRRLGDVEAAWELVQQAVAAGDWPEPVASLLVWDREGPEPALYRLDKALRSPQRSRFSRAALIPAFAEVAIACGKAALAEEHVAELEALADVGQTNVLRGYASGTRGRLRMATGDLDGARSSFETALRAWSVARVPFEGARDRLALASVLSTRGDRVGAETEAREALRVLEDLGAEPEARHARELLSSLAPASVEPLRRTTLMFTDVVASTTLAETIGDEAWRDLSAWLDGMLRAQFVAHEGTEIDHAGDGFFVSFESPTLAVACAVELQKVLAAHRREHGFAPQVRIGIHCGRVATNKGALRGVAVNRAARICALAQGGQIIASSEAAEAAGREPLRSWTEQLRGVRGPVEVCEISWRPEPVSATSG